MSRDETDIMAGEYVLGTMEPERRRAFVERLRREPELRSRVAAWEIALTRLEDSAEMLPPAALWSRLSEAVERERAASLLTTVRQGEGAWIAIGPGLEKKHLYQDPQTGLESCLIRMQPGATFEAHYHANAEECLVLEGDLRIGDVQLKAGDYQVAAPGTHHPVLSSRNGAVLYVRGADIQAA